MVARAVNKARAQYHHGNAEVAIVAEDQSIRLDLGLRVAIAVALGQRLALVGAVVVPGRVDTETAHVQKTG